MGDDTNVISPDAPLGGYEPLDPSRAPVPYTVRVNAVLVRRGFWPKFRRVAAGLPFGEDLAALWFCAFDRETPAGTKALILAALAAFVVPKRFLPRRLPGLNLADEGALAAAAVAALRRSIKDHHREAARALLAKVAGS